jgi:hypothetical protein
MSDKKLSDKFAALLKYHEYDHGLHHFQLRPILDAVRSLEANLAESQRVGDELALELTRVRGERDAARTAAQRLMDLIFQPFEDTGIVHDEVTLEESHTQLGLIVTRLTAERDGWRTDAEHMKRNVDGLQDIIAEQDRKAYRQDVELDVAHQAIDALETEVKALRAEVDKTEARERDAYCAAEAGFQETISDLRAEVERVTEIAARNIRECSDLRIQKEIRDAAWEHMVSESEAADAARQARREALEWALGRFAHWDEYHAHKVADDVRAELDKLEE